MWFLENLARFNHERQVVCTLDNESDWLTVEEWVFGDGAQVEVLAVIRAGGGQFEIRMVYPSVYPACPPAVFPRDPSARWSSHQYGVGGELCLELGPDNWQSDFTGADSLSSAYRLLSAETVAGPDSAQEIPSRHELTVGQQLRNTELRFCYHQSQLDSLLGEQAAMARTGKADVILHTKSLVGFLRSLQQDDGEWRNPIVPELPSAFSCPLTFFDTSIDGSAFPHGDLEEARRQLIAAGCDVASICETGDGGALNHRFIIVRDVSGKIHVRQIASWQENRMRTYVPVQLDAGGDELRLSPTIQGVGEKRVGIVGLGSAGSKIAVSLARTGVTRFILVDDDILLPANLVRHSLDWRAAGLHKTEAVADQLRLVNSEVDVVSRSVRLSGQEATATAANALQALGECDIVVDATANAATFNRLADVVAQRKVALVWLEIYAGGIGGLVARCRPGRDPNPQEMRAGLNAYLSALPKPENEPVAPYAVERGETTIVGTDADVSTIAGYATQMVLDILTAQEPSRFPHSIYLVGMDRDWVFEEPFDTRPIDVKDPGTTRTHAMSESEAKETVALLEDMIGRRTSGSPSSDQD